MDINIGVDMVEDFSKLMESEINQLFNLISVKNNELEQEQNGLVENIPIITPIKKEGKSFQFFIFSYILKLIKNL